MEFVSRKAWKKSLHVPVCQRKRSERRRQLQVSKQV